MNNYMRFTDFSRDKICLKIRRSRVGIIQISKKEKEFSYFCIMKLTVFSYLLNYKLKYD